jgi:hypothetical protein
MPILSNIDRIVKTNTTAQPIRVAAMSRSLLGWLFVLCFVLVLYVLKVYSLKNTLDIFQTDTYYHSWIDNISDEVFEYESIYKVYIYTLANISAPEPISSILILAIQSAVKISPELLIDLANVIYLCLAVLIIARSGVPWLFKIMLLLLLSLGYYEFTLLHSTHRFKIAVIMFLIYQLSSKRFPRAASIVLSLSFLTHFSLFPAIPLLYFLRQAGYQNIPSPNVRLISIFAIGVSLLIYFSALIDQADLVSFADSTVIKLENKLSHASLDIYSSLIIFGAALCSFPIFRRLEKSFKSRHTELLAISYAAISLAVIGTSVMVFSYYSILMSIFVATYSTNQPDKQKKIISVISLLGIYSLYKGISYAPLPLLLM